MKEPGTGHASQGIVTTLEEYRMVLSLDSRGLFAQAHTLQR
jgi:hypothetical protein